MDIGKILKDDLDLVMKKVDCYRTAKLDIYWNDKYKTLVVVEKKNEKYDAHVVKVCLVGEDKMRRCSYNITTDSLSSLGSMIENRIHRVSDKIKGAGIRDPHTSLHVLLTFDDHEEITSPPPIIQEIHQFPDEGGFLGYVCDRNFQQTTNRIYITDEMLLHHIIVTGTTGFGKTSLTRRIITEVNKENRTVFVLTPESHLQKWRTITNSVLVDEEIVEGKINIANFSYSDNIKEESNRILRELINQYSKFEETNGVKLVVVIDESEQFDQERITDCVRTLRKFGVGCIIINHKFTGDGGVDGAIRTNVSTHISTLTTWQPDVQEMKKYQPKGTIDYANLLLHSPKGYCVIRSSFVNRGQPTPCKFLQEYEKSQFVDITQKEHRIDDVLLIGKRKMVIYDIIKTFPNATAKTIGKVLKNRGMLADNSTVSRDLKDLQSGDFIMISKIGDKNEKHYQAKKKLQGP